MTLIKSLTFLFFGIIVAISAQLAFKLHANSVEDKKLKLDYFLVNQIKYGLLSGDKWTLQVNRIIGSKVDSFSFDKKDKTMLTKQVDGLLNAMLDELSEVLHEPQEKLKDRIKYKVINTFVTVDKFRPEIPRFTKTILAQLDKKENKEALKKLVTDKVTEVLNAASQDTAQEQHKILARYNCQSISEFNSLIQKRTTILGNTQQKDGYFLIACLMAVLIAWLLILRGLGNYSAYFLISVLISLVALIVGISLPMIEIDARIARLDLNLLGSHVVFEDQVIFFQTKSILDVIRILLSHGKVDSTFVGVLILLFSVLFPVTKLISASIYLYSRNKSNGFINYMAFKSGKWSMADVMVIAIFMAYVGFQGILDDQLADITVHNDVVNMISTNGTRLQSGFVIFVSFVIYNLVLAEILKKICKIKKTKKAPSEGEAQF